MVHGCDPPAKPAAPIDWNDTANYPREFSLKIRLEQGEDGGARCRKLRAWLKYSLRAFGVRCVSIEPAAGKDGRA